MHRIRHIAITAEDPFATAELFKRKFGLAELSRGDGDIARAVYLFHVDDLAAAETRARATGATDQLPPTVDLAKMVDGSSSRRSLPGRCQVRPLG